MADGFYLFSPPLETIRNLLMVSNVSPLHHTPPQFNSYLNKLNNKIWNKTYGLYNN